MIPENLRIQLLTKQLSESNQLAFGKLYDLYSKPLYRNIFRLVKDEDIAKELLQDLFMKIWEIRENIDPNKSFKSFLYKIAENLVYGHYRKVAKDQKLLEKLTQISTEYDTNIEDFIVSKESHALLHKALEKLSPQRKIIYELCKLEGKSYKEVGEKLGISTSTVHNQIIKANKTVRQYFLVNQDIAVLLIVGEILHNLK